MNEGPPDEIQGILTIESEAIKGRFGTYWHVTLWTGESGGSIPATLSEKVWSRTGLPQPDVTSAVRGTIQRNRNGRWSVIDLDIGPREHLAIQSTVVQVETEAQSATSPGADGTNAAEPGAAVRSFQLRLHPSDGAAFETWVSARAMRQFGITSLPVGCSFQADWVLESGGWRPTRIDDASLRAFFPEAADGLPLADGYVETAWHFGDGAKDLTVHFRCGIPGVSFRCRLIAAILRAAGNRNVEAGAPVRAQLSLRDGRWRIAELVEPRPDLRTSGQILFAVETRLAFRETNNFGEEVNWLELVDETEGPGVASLAHSKLLDIDENDLRPGAVIVCDLKHGRRGWYASKIHRIADAAMAGSSHPQSSVGDTPSRRRR